MAVTPGAFSPAGDEGDAEHSAVLRGYRHPVPEDDLGFPAGSQDEKELFLQWLGRPRHTRHESRLCSALAICRRPPAELIQARVAVPSLCGCPDSFVKRRPPWCESLPTVVGLPAQPGSGGGSNSANSDASGAWKIATHSSRSARVIGSASQGGDEFRISMRRQSSSGGTSR